MSSEDDWVGKTLGNYTLRSVIGKGGMGMVFAGEHRFLHEKVAVKILHGNFAQNEGVARRFFQEATSTRAIDHPNIIKIFDFGQREPEGDLYLVMELLEGESFARVLKGGQRLDEPHAARICAEIADGLEAAHQQGVIHRDLKPDNVFINQQTGMVKVLDFGVAKLQGGVSSTRAGAVLGTPEFMAPEQAKSSSKVGPATDIYALGVILFRACTGRLPFQSQEMLEMITQHIFEPPPRPSAIVPISSEMEALILHCLEKDPAKRPPSMADVRDRLLPRAATSEDWDDNTRQVYVAKEARGASKDTFDSLIPISEDSGAPEVTAQSLAPVHEPAPERPPSNVTPTADERPHPRSEPGHPPTSAGEVVRVPAPVVAPSSRWPILAAAGLLLLGGIGTGLIVVRRSGGKPDVPMASVAGPLGPKPTTPIVDDPPPADPPPAAPEPVTVVLRSVPAGAEVRVDGELKGTTPATISLLLPQRVELSLAGYKTAHHNVTDEENNLVRLAAVPRVAAKPAGKGGKGGKPTFLAPSFMKPDAATKKPREGLD